jgi:hypothetical protein
MNNAPAYIKTDTSISICFEDGVSITVIKDNSKNFSTIVELIKNKKYDEVRNMCNNEYVLLEYGIVIKDNKLYLNGVLIDNTLSIRIIKMLDEGFDVTPMILFLKNLMLNPSEASIESLYDFLEYGKLPITEDGHFLAYKVVTNDFKDTYTRSIDNSVGALVQMDRALVDPDRNQTCSRGLHMCSYDYIKHFETLTSRTVIIKINPKDVVTIPKDYNNTKGRCCAYTVLTEIINPTPRTLPDLLAKETKVCGNDIAETVECDSNLIKMFNEILYGDEEEEEIDLEVKEYHKPDVVDNTMKDLINKIDDFLETKAETPEGNTILVKKLIMSSIDGTDIKTFDSVREASEYTKIDADNIRRVCRGKRITTGGFKWRFEQQ